MGTLCHTSERLCHARASLHSSTLLCNLLSSAVDGVLEHVGRYSTCPLHRCSRLPLLCRAMRGHNSAASWCSTLPHMGPMLEDIVLRGALQTACALRTVFGFAYCVWVCTMHYEKVWNERTMLSMSDIGRFGGDWSAMAPASLQMTRGFTLLDFGLTCSPEGATDKASLQLLVLLQPCLCRFRHRRPSPGQAKPFQASITLGPCLNQVCSALFSSGI